MDCFLLLIYQQQLIAAGVCDVWQKSPKPQPTCFKNSCNCKHLYKYVPGTRLPLMFYSCLKTLEFLKKQLLWCQAEETQPTRFVGTGLPRPAETQPLVNLSRLCSLCPLSSSAVRNRVTFTGGLTPAAGCFESKGLARQKPSTSC